MNTNNKVVIVIFILMISASCHNNNNNRLTYESSNKQIDSLKSVISQLESNIKWIERENPFVQRLHTEASTCMIIHFKPVGLNIKLNNTRPSVKETTFLCVPAAFTSPQKTIEGIFIENGRLINRTRNNEVNGFAMFNEYNFIIDNIDSLTGELIENAQKEKYNLFQQVLLVKNSKIVNCDLFKNKINTRRAIVKYPDYEIYIVESHRPMTILEFQQALVEIGVAEALYLDMGTWSEGWYKSSNCELIKIGENFLHTKRQTNWLTFEKQEK